MDAYDEYKINLKKKKRIILIISLIVIGLFFIVSFVDASLDSYAPVKQGDCVDLKQGCSSCTYVNFSVAYPNSSLILIEGSGSDVGGGLFTYEFCNTTQFGRYDVSGHGDLEGSDKRFDALYFEVSESGELFSNTQGYLILGQLGIIALLLIIGFSFEKFKWKLRSIFFICALLMGIITLNSIRIIAGASQSLSNMGSTGLILGIIILSFMFLYLLINYTIEVFRYFKEKRKMKWETNMQ